MFAAQGVVQMYSVVLGLEVLGNPVGFVRGLTSGTVGLFYHPLQVYTFVCVCVCVCVYERERERMRGASPLLNSLDERIRTPAHFSKCLHSSTLSLVATHVWCPPSPPY